MKDQKLQQLIETLKKQGVESGEETSRRIVEEAKREAEAIVSRAKATAADIIERAEREAENRMRQLQSSMEIAASQFVTNLKRAIEDRFLVVPLKKSIRNALEQTEFLQELIRIAVTEFARSRGGSEWLVAVPPDQREKLEDFVADLARVEAGGESPTGVSLSIEGVPFGFMISPSDGKVRLDFTDEAFLALFLRYLAPRFRKLFQDIQLRNTGTK